MRAVFVWARQGEDSRVSVKRRGMSASLMNLADLVMFLFFAVTDVLLVDHFLDSFHVVPPSVAMGRISCSVNWHRSVRVHSS